MSLLTPDELLTTTRSVRKRLDFERPVPRRVIEECLEVALQAPNGSNLQLWQWLVVDERELVAELATLYNDAIADYAEAYASDTMGLGAEQAPGFDRMTESVLHLARNLHRAPALVIPCIAGRLENRGVFHQASLWGSILPAAWSFMLALRSRGLGSAWTTVHLHRERQAAELVGIPASHTQAGLFPVAWTVGRQFRPAQRRPLSEVLHWNRW
jgi:nitroreductase